MRVTRCLTSLLAAVLAMAATASAQNAGSRSAAAARDLARVLDAEKLEAVAGRDPEQPNHFVAALYYPGVQLLVVSADYAAPEQLQQRIEQRQFLEAYMDLQGAGTREGKMFVTDLQADGLHRVREQGAPFDIVYRDGAQHMAYHGNWSAQNVSEAQYNDAFTKDDTQYAHMLQVLIAALQQRPSPEP